MAEIENNLSVGTNEKVQLAGFVSAFQELRGIP
jgi:hypothetical protein